MCLRGVPVCFIACHLAARPDRLGRREMDYCQIARKLALQHGEASAGQDFLHAFDHCFWLGDVNYRVRARVLQGVAAHTEGRAAAVVVVVVVVVVEWWWW
jgi:hypothetical protein